MLTLARLTMSAEGRHRRREWSPDSPLFDKARAAPLPVTTLDYEYRIAATEGARQNTTGPPHRTASRSPSQLMALD
jgi:hypothetical protein